MLSMHSIVVRLISSFFFFFKQKTAYEMRISDWSSDVCSSDLRPLKYQTVEELDLAIQNYFAECDPHTTKALVETGRDGQGNMLFDTRTILTEQRSEERRVGKE